MLAFGRKQQSPALADEFQPEDAALYELGAVRPPLNMRRGLWRLWLVASLLWVVGAGLWTAPAWRAHYDAMMAEAPPPSLVRQIYLTHRNQPAVLGSEERRRLDIAAIRRDQPELRALGDDQIYAEYEKLLGESIFLQERFDRPYFAVTVAPIFAPPLLAMLLFFAFRWVARGFAA